MAESHLPSPFGKEQEKLAQWRAEFALDLRSEQRWRTYRKKWGNYYDGKQWTEEEKMKMQERGQPPLVMNMIKPRVDTLQGMFLQTPIMMRAIDRGLEDFDKGKYVTEALRYIEDMNDFNETERIAIKEQLISGRAWYYVEPDFDYDDVEIKIEAVDSQDIIRDRYAKKQDLSDCDRIYRTFWVDIADLITRFPRHKEEIEASVTRESNFANILDQYTMKKLGDQYKSSGTGVDGKLDDIFYDSKRRRVRFIHMWYRETYMREYAVHDDLENGRAEVTEFSEELIQKVKDLFPGVEFYTKKAHRLNSAIFIRNAILEEKEDIRSHDPYGKYPFVMLSGYEETDEERMPYGYVRQLIDPQDAYNKSRSKIVHKQNSATTIFDQGAFPNEEEARHQVHRPDGWIKKKKGYDVNIDRGQVNNADIAMINFAIQEMQSSGLPAELMGQEGQDLSGKAIQLRQNSGLQPLRPLMANARKARKRLFTIVLEEIQRFWTYKKIIKITDDPNAESIVLNNIVTDETGNEVVVNEIGLGKYDIKIEESPQTENLRAEQFDKLIQMVKDLIAMGTQVPMQTVIELVRSSDVHNKEGIIQSLVEQQQAQMQMVAAQAQQQGGAYPQ